MYVYDSSGDLNEGQIQYTITALSSVALGIQDYDTLVSSLPTLEQDGIDRITQTIKTVVAAAGTQPDLIRSDTYAWTNNETDSQGTLISSVETATAGTNVWIIKFADANAAITNQTEVSYSGTAHSITETAVDGSYSVASYPYGRLLSSIRYD